MTHPFANETFDRITAVAALHHLSLEAALIRFRDLLVPGGILAVMGLYRLSTIED
jgi:SAM-dependent methyltransferase